MRVPGFHQVRCEVFPCEADLIYELLTEYDAYSEWMPFVATSRLLAREGSSLAIAEFETVRARDRVILEWIHTPKKAVLGRIIAGKTSISEIEWSIEPANPGHVAASLRIQRQCDWRSVHPAHRKFMNPTACLRALRSRISAFLPDFPAPGANREAIVDLWETESGFVCWIHGKKYTLVPARDTEQI